VSEFSSGPWVLDVDEDFFSCNNPYGDEFWDLFGMDMYSCLTEVYDLNEQNICSEAIKEIYKKQLYNQPWRKFSKLSIVKELMQNMQCDEDCVERHMRKFHKFVRKTWPQGGYEDSDDEDENDDEADDEKEPEEMDDIDMEIAILQTMEEEYYEDEDERQDEDEAEEEAEEWNVPHFFDLNALHRAGNLSCLPHHISTAHEIKTLANQVEGLLAELPNPAHVTLATSRLDRYLPDSQDLLKVLYDSENIQRLDRPKFSVDNVPVEDQGKLKARDILDICEQEEGSERKRGV